MATALPVESAAMWVEPVKPTAEDTERAAAEAASAKRRRTIKIAAGVAAGVLVALFIGLTIALAVTYSTRNKGGDDNPTGAVTVPATQETGQVENAGAKAEPVQGEPKEHQHSPFYRDASQVVVTTLMLHQAEALDVASWPATVVNAGEFSSSEHGAEEDRDIYVEKGQLMVTSFISDDKKKTATIVVASAGDLCTLPAGVRTTLTYTQQTTIRTKTY